MDWIILVLNFSFVHIYHKSAYAKFHPSRAMSPSSSSSSPLPPSSSSSSSSLSSSLREPLRILHVIWSPGRLTKCLIIKWLAAPCYRIICMRKFTVNNFNFCQYFDSGLRTLATTLGLVVLFKLTVISGKEQDCVMSLEQSSHKNCRNPIQYKSRGIWREHMLNSWQIYLISCVFR